MSHTGSSSESKSKSKTGGRGLHQVPAGLLASMNSMTSAASSESSSSAYSFGFNRRVLQNHKNHKSKSSSKSYDETMAAMRNIEQKGRHGVERAKSSPFVQLDLSVSEGFQVFDDSKEIDLSSSAKQEEIEVSENKDKDKVKVKDKDKAENKDKDKEMKQKRSRHRRAPSRSKSADACLPDFAQLDLTAHSVSGVQFVQNKTVESLLVDLPKSPVDQKHDSPSPVDQKHGSPSGCKDDGEILYASAPVDVGLTPRSIRKLVRLGSGMLSKMKNHNPPKSSVDHDHDIPSDDDDDEILPAPPLEGETSLSSRRLRRMGSGVLSNMKKNNNSSRAPDGDRTDRKKRLFAFGNRSFGSIDISGELLDDDSGAFSE
jgi:hypothetical protein